MKTEKEIEEDREISEKILVELEEHAKKEIRKNKGKSVKELMEDFRATLRNINKLKK